MADNSGEEAREAKDPFGFTKPFEDTKEDQTAGKVAPGLVTPDDDPITSALVRGFRRGKRSANFMLQAWYISLGACAVALLVLATTLFRMQAQDDRLEFGSTIDIGEYDSVNRLIELPDGRLWITGEQTESWVWTPGNDDPILADFSLRKFGTDSNNAAILGPSQVVISENGRFRILDFKTGERVASLNSESWSGGPISVLEAEIIAIEPGGRLSAWSTDAPGPIELTFETGISTPLQIEHVGEGRAVILDGEGGVTVVDLVGEQTIPLDAGKGSSSATHLEVLPSGSVAVGYSGGTVRIWDPLLPEQRPDEFIHAGLAVTVEVDEVEDFYKRNPDNPDDFISGGFDSDEIVSITALADDQVAVATYDGTVRVWSAAAPRIQPLTYVSSEEINQPRIDHVIQLDDGRIVAASQQEGDVKILETGRFQPPEIFEVHESGIVDLLLLKDGRIASVDRRAVVQIWDVPG